MQVEKVVHVAVCGCVSLARSCFFVLHMAYVIDLERRMCMWLFLLLSTVRCLIIFSLLNYFLIIALTTCSFSAASYMRRILSVSRSYNQMTVPIVPRRDDAEAPLPIQI